MNKMIIETKRMIADNELSTIEKHNKIAACLYEMGYRYSNESDVICGNAREARSIFQTFIREDWLNKCLEVKEKSERVYNI